MKKKMSQKVEKVHNFLDLPLDDLKFWNFGKIGNLTSFRKNLELDWILDFGNPPSEKNTLKLKWG